MSRKRKRENAERRASEPPRAAAVAPVSLAPELLEQCVAAVYRGFVDSRALAPSDGDAGGALCTASRRSGAHKPPSSAAARPAAPPQSKSERRRAAKAAAAGALRSERASTLSALASTALPPSAQALLRPASRVGQRETAKEGLARALRHERAGIPLPDGVPLLRARRDAAGDDDDGDAAVGDTAVRPGGDATLPSVAPQPAPEAQQPPQQQPPQQQPPPGGPSSALAALAARARGTAPRRPDRASLKRHKLRDNPKDDDEAPQDRPAAAAAAAALRPLADALRAAAVAGGEARAADDDADALRPSSLPPRSAAPVPPAPPVLRQLYVRPKRTAAAQAARLELPMLAAEQEVMEAVAAHPIVVLCGETGCGKTTQLPQFLFEAGYGFAGGPTPGAVAVTQPRRVAVFATATRVAAELGSPLGVDVGYAVRHDGGVGVSAPLRFLTDGVLLAEASSDLLLSRYSAIVVDEAHERSAATDMLLGLLSRIVPLRSRLAATPGSGVAPLKLIVMSATLRVDDFAANTRLCPVAPPVLRVEARQHAVTIHFARRTPPAGRHSAAAFKKVVAIHKSLPSGAILVFLEGRREVEALCAQLRARFPPARADAEAAAGDGGGGGRSSGGGGGGGGGEEAAEAGGFDRDAIDAAADDEDGDGGDWAGGDDACDEDGDDNDDGGLSEEEATAQLGGGDGTPPPLPPDAAGADATAPATPAPDGSDPGPLHVVPLYASLPPSAQAAAFAPPPPGCRLVIVATNVAETSLTLPGVRYVVDAGVEKRRIFSGCDASADGCTGGGGGGGGGCARFVTGWISQASAAQRAGRAGRTAPGHAYRLYSSAHFSSAFPLFSPPDLLAQPLEGVALRLKALGVDRPAAFPFPSPPPRAAMEEAERALTRLGALEPAATGAATAGQPSSGCGSLTKIGAAMAKLPVEPRAARFLVAAAAECAARRAPPPPPPPAAGVAGKKRRRGTKSASSSRDGGDASSRPEALLPLACAVAAAMSCDSPFVREAAGGRGAGAALAAHAEQQNAAAAAAVVPQGATKGGRADALSFPPPQLSASEAERVAWAGRGGGGRHAPFADPSSDALAAAHALLAYEAAVAAAGNTSHGASAAASRLGAARGAAFCSAHGLSEKALREAAALRRQLARLLAAQAPALLTLFHPPTHGGADAAGVSAVAERVSSALRLSVRSPPDVAPLVPSNSSAARVALRRSLAAGWADRLARRAKPPAAAAAAQQEEEDAAQPGGGPRFWGAGGSGGGNRAVRYAASHAPFPVFLHPSSFLAAAAPEWVVYTELLVSGAKRPYMLGATAVDAAWLASVSPSSVSISPLPKVAPEPEWDESVDCVVGWHAVALTRSHGGSGGGGGGAAALEPWDLPDTRVPLRLPPPPRQPRGGSDDAATLRVVCAFASALLRGRVFPATSFHASPPTASPLAPRIPLLDHRLFVPPLPATGSAVASARGLRRVGDLIAALALARVASRRSVAAAWAVDPAWLRPQLRAWVRAGADAQRAFDASWPKLVAAAIAAADNEQAAA